MEQNEFDIFNEWARRDRKRPKVEFVNRSGEIVDPKTGKAHNRPIGRRIRRRRGGIRRTLPIKMEGVMFGGLNAIPTDVTRDPPPGACFNCWQRGHAQRDCPRTAVAILCNNCGRRGTNVKNCQRCSHAYVLYVKSLKARGINNDENEYETKIELDYENRCNDVLEDLIVQQKRDQNARYLDYQDCQYVYDERQNQSLTRNSPPPVYPERQSSYTNNWSRRREVEAKEDEDESRYRNSSNYYTSRENSGGIGSSMPLKFEQTYTGLEEASSSHSDLSKGDPVQDILLLAKSISHLPSDTQDLIMRQVMEERREKARQRSLEGQMRNSWF